MALAEVRLWGRRIGAVEQAAAADYATFQYQPEFADSGIEIAPLMMPLARRPYQFPELPRAGFSGLPGLLADSLPDYFGNALIDTWLAHQGRSPGGFNAVERLCYVGSRGMGALEFKPATGPQPTKTHRLEVEELVELTSRILGERQHLTLSLDSGAEQQTLAELLRVGTSAGGARAKALIALNPATNEVRSGQIEAGSGFEYWILKFDGVSGHGDDRFSNPLGYGAIEMAYSFMAREAGINMTDCRLLDEGERSHFMTRRFDRTVDGKKLHMLSLGGMAHLDYNAAGIYGYELALLTIRRLGLSMDDIEQQFRRMVFNILARNQDDHVKNIAFLMDKDGRWSLSPAFDVTYAYNPAGDWTTHHQMTVNGKRDGFSLADLDAVAQAASMVRGRSNTIYEEIRQAVVRWSDFAELAGVSGEQSDKIQRALRIELPRA